MNNISEIINKKKCTGCGACSNICPQKAISMKINSEGFLVPMIDKIRCNNCDLCNHICPMINIVSEEFQYQIPKVYAGWNKNEKIRFESSSGGIFSALAGYFFKKKGYVCGAAFDNKNHLRHIIISNKKDLKKLRGSKYVQSEIGNVYRKIRFLLNNNKWVLFSGTPCQAAGLKNFLKKDYKKLLIVDLVCHGVPSPLVFDKYLKGIEKKYKMKINDIEFRSKATGWKTSSFILKNNKNYQFFKEIFYRDIYGSGFLNNLYLRPICTNCIYSKIPKVSDITLGDFWGASKYNDKLDDDKGVSLILVNNQKGLVILSELKRKMIVHKNIPLEIVINNNYPVLIPSEEHVNRMDFFNEFNKKQKKIDELILKYLDNGNQVSSLNNHSVGVLNFHYENYNFGANLVSYSLCKTIEKLGFCVKNINYIPFKEQSVIEKACSLGFYKFREKFIKMTKLCTNYNDLVKLNNQFDIFIVGSDQVWRNLITKNNALHYFFDFVSSSKKMFSYGASFGHNYWDGDDYTTESAKKLLKRFIAVSTREKDGVSILSKKFDRNDSICVLDPTFLLGKKDYEEIIKDESIKPIKGKYIAYYFLFDNGNIKYSKKMDKILNYTKYKLIDIKGEEKEMFGKNKFFYNSVSKWLSYLKKCNCLITDSYHGVIFAIIFGKNFVCIGKKSNAVSRFENLFSLLGIKNRFFSSLDEIKNNKIFLNEINYTMIYKKLNIERKKSLSFLKKNLNVFIPDKDKIDKLEGDFVQLFSKNNDLEFQNQSLQTRLHELELTINSYLNTKSFRYIRKFKKILLKFGIKKFKL